MENNDHNIDINNLPDEVICMVLESNVLSCRDALRFGLTNNRFHELVNGNQSFWKSMSKKIFCKDVFKAVSETFDGHWLMEVKSYCELKKNICEELRTLSRKYYWKNIQQDKVIELREVGQFFDMAATKSTNYYQAVVILCDISKKGIHFAEINPDSVSSFNLTEMYYAKIVNRYLIHSFLVVDWVQKMIKSEQTPEFVIQFFLQWIDTTNLYLQEHVKDELSIAVQKVKSLLNSSHPLLSTPSSVCESWGRGKITNNQWNHQDNLKILAAIQQVLYKQKTIIMPVGLSVETLSIVKALNNGLSNACVVAATFSAIARRCGVLCEQVAFPDHMFLRWKEDYRQTHSQGFSINLSNGNLETTRMCPFASARAQIKYCPSSLLQFLYAEYQKTMGAIRDWSMQNLCYLLDIIGTDYEPQNRPYAEMLPNIVQMSTEDDHLHVPETEFSLRKMDSEQLNFILSLVKRKRRFLRYNDDILEVPEKKCVKRHDPHVRFAVGMICSHLRYNYVCVIRGWDPQCVRDKLPQERNDIASLKHGYKQPFYSVLAADYSERYVAQADLKELVKPSRLYHLEDKLGPEFTGFDGFAYVPNQEKQAEYPTDGPVRALFKFKGNIRDSVD